MDASDIGLFAQLACVWEATARKPGNVHRYRDFADTTYLDFVTSAAASASILATASGRPVGATVLEAVRRTRQVSRANTNLGILLLLAPLARAAGGNPRADLPGVLNSLTIDDAVDVYSAIRLANPGGLGQANAQDVSGQPTLTLRQVMALAADRDLIARQIANGYCEVFDIGVPAVQEGLAMTGSLEGAIVFAHLHCMSAFPDSLIARKLDTAMAEEARRRAQAVLQAGWPGTETSCRLLTGFDEWLRADGNRRNPGTTADLIAGCLFVLLCERTIPLPFSWPWACAALEDSPTP
jgi:triphosphoribosyl-dephospho-CoA synthase